MEEGAFIPISPITKIKTIVYTQMEVKILRLHISKNMAEIIVNVYDETKQNVKHFVYAMSGTDYLNWTTDNYLINWCQNKLRNEVF